MHSLFLLSVLIRSSIARQTFEKELYEGFVAGLAGFDQNRDGVLTRAELAVGILVEPLENATEPWAGTPGYALGQSLCNDPYPDSVSLNECLVAEAREAPPTS